MKTLYTLLLAFGLCLTVHSQSHAVYTLSEKKLLLNNQEQIDLDTSLYESLPTVIFSDNQVYKAFTTTNSINKKIFLEDQYIINNTIQGYNLSDFQTAEVLALKWKTGKSYDIDTVLLKNMTNLKYIHLISLDNITTTEAKTLLKDILTVLNVNVEVILEISQES